MGNIPVVICENDKHIVDEDNLREDND